MENLAHIIVKIGAVREDYYFDGEPLCRLALMVGKWFAKPCQPHKVVEVRFL